VRPRRAGGGTAGGPAGAAAAGRWKRRAPKKNTRSPRGVRRARQTIPRRHGDHAGIRPPAHGALRIRNPLRKFDIGAGACSRANGIGTSRSNQRPLAASRGLCTGRRERGPRHGPFAAGAQASPPEITRADLRNACAGISIRAFVQIFGQSMCGGGTASCWCCAGEGPLGPALRAETDPQPKECRHACPWRRRPFARGPNRPRRPRQRVHCQAGRARGAFPIATRQKNAGHAARLAKGGPQAANWPGASWKAAGAPRRDLYPMYRRASRAFRSGNGLAQQVGDSLETQIRHGPRTLGTATDFFFVNTSRTRTSAGEDGDFRRARFAAIQAGIRTAAMPGPAQPQAQRVIVTGDQATPAMWPAQICASVPMADLRADKRCGRDELPPLQPSSNGACSARSARSRRARCCDRVRGTPVASREVTAPERDDVSPDTVGPRRARRHRPGRTAIVRGNGR